MSDSYDKVLKNVSLLLADYPSESKLFGSTQKFVLFLKYSTKFQEHLYDYLVEKAEVGSHLTPYRMLVPAKMNDENVTFVFYDLAKTPKTVAEELADAIYMIKVILKNPMTAKVLCIDGFYSCPNEYENLCSDCLGLINCGIYPQRPCYTEESLDYGLQEVEIPKLRNEFFKFLAEKLNFETIDPTTIKWEIRPETTKTVMYYFNDFNKDIAGFARKVCDYIAPNHSYANTSITLQNQTYVRFQAANAFRFIKKVDVGSGMIQPADYLYVPDNLVEVFRQINESTAGIQNDWQQILETIRNIDELKHLRGPGAVRQLMEGCRTNLNEIRTKEYLHLNIDERTQKLRDLRDRIEDYQNGVDRESDMFKEVVARKFEDITANLIGSIVQIHADSFSQSLGMLDTLMDTNIQDLQGSQISGFFKNLSKKVDKYFSYSNAYMINSWFLLHRHRVPYDWQARLAGFGRSDKHWLMPAYEMQELEEIIRKEVLTFSEFVYIVDLSLRESFETFFEDFESCIRPTRYYFLVLIDRWKLEGLTQAHNFTQLFENWKQIARSKVPSSFIELLQAKYEQSFTNFSIDTVRLTFQNSVKRAVLFVGDNLDFVKDKLDPGGIHREMRYSHPKVQTIFQQLQAHARPLYEEFTTSSMDRIIQNMVRIEILRIDPVLERLSGVLTEFLASHYADFELLKVSQPNKKMITLKYSLIRYENFLRDTKVIFDSNYLEMPREDLEYLESIQLKFVGLQKQAELSSIEGRINTRWNWGRGFRSDQKNVENSGDALMNFGVKSLTSAVQNGSFFIFVIWCLLLLFRNRI